MKNINIQIDGIENTGQRYILQIITRGTENQDISTLPQNKFVLSEPNKDTVLKMALHTQYTIRVFKTDAKSIEEIMKEPKNTTAKGPIKEMVKEMNFTPTKNADTLTIDIINTDNAN